MNYTSVHSDIDQRYPDEQLDGAIIPKLGGSSGHVRGDDHRRVESTRQSLACLIDFITFNKKLQLLDISYMALGDKLLQITDAIILSGSVLSVHLGDNNLSQKAIEEILIKFGIHKKNLGPSSIDGNDLVDDPAHIRQSGALQNAVNDAYKKY